MSSTKHRNPPVLGKSTKQSKTKDFDSKKKHTEKDTSFNDDLYDPKKPTKSLFQQFVELDLQLSSIFFVCASPTSKWGFCRPLIKVIEIFGDGLVWMLVPVAFLIVTEEKWLIEFCVNILAATAFDLCVLFLLKMLASRPRPIANKGDMLIVVAVDNYSFPSGHCTRAGMMTYIIIEYFNMTGGYIALGGVWVVIMAISRLMLGRHYITDVICGTIVGFMEGAVVIAFWITVDNLESILSLFDFRT